MSKRFKDVNVGDKLYFIISNSDGISLSESRVEEIRYNKNLVEFVNDTCYCAISIDSYINDNSVSIKNNDSFIAVYTEQECADTCYGSLIETNRSLNKSKESMNEGDDYDCEEAPDMLYTKDELDAMSGKEFKEALDNMSFHEMLYHGLETLKEVFGLHPDEKETTEKSKEEDETVEESIPVINVKYPVPSSDAIIKKLNTDAFGLNKDGGLNSTSALLVITVKESGIYTLDENHFNGCNPLFQGPKFYFHNITIPAFNEDANGESIDSVYRAIEDWIYKTYPEFEAIEYGEDWQYDILRGQDYTVNTNEVDFNIFK